MHWWRYGQQKQVLKLDRDNHDDMSQPNDYPNYHNVDGPVISRDMMNCDDTVDDVTWWSSMMTQMMTPLITRLDDLWWLCWWHLEDLDWNSFHKDSHGQIKNKWSIRGGTKMNDYHLSIREYILPHTVPLQRFFNIQAPGAIAFEAVLTHLYSTLFNGYHPLPDNAYK